MSRVVFVVFVVVVIVIVIGGRRYGAAAVRVTRVSAPSEQRGASIPTPEARKRRHWGWLGVSLLREQQGHDEPQDRGATREQTRGNCRDGVVEQQGRDEVDGGAH